MPRSSDFYPDSPFMNAPAADMANTTSASEMQGLHYPSDIPNIASNPFSLFSEEDSNMWAPDPTTIPTVNPSCIATNGANDFQPYFANAQPFHKSADTKGSNDGTSHRIHHGQVTPPSEHSPSTSFSIPPHAYKPADLQSGVEASSKVPAKRRRRGGSRRRGDSRGADLRASASAEPSPPGDDKQEKTRARNRLAASKCRQKKKVQNTQLESIYEYERIRHEELTRTVNSLRDAIVAAKTQLLAHSECGHESTKAYIQSMAKKITVQDDGVDFAAVPAQYYGCGSSDQKSGLCGFEFDAYQPTA